MRGGDVSRRLVWLDPAYAERTKKVLSASERLRLSRGYLSRISPALAMPERYVPLPTRSLLRLVRKPIVLARPSVKGGAAKLFA
jgi:hypothetical protein